MRRSSKLLCALALACGAAPAAAQEAEPDTRPLIGVMTTIPIFWGEPSGNPDDFLGLESLAHWARPELERRYALRALDMLPTGSLSVYDGLLLAQPRGLTPEENVALDSYLHAGGKVLLFVDPMMTGESAFGIGDRRRPQDVALMSPILARWGLSLRFDDTQDEGVTLREFAGQPVPVNLPGIFERTGEGVGICTTEAAGLIARCLVGKGEVLAVADAAILDLHGPHDGAREALAALAARILPENGDGAGRAGEIPIEIGESPAIPSISAPLLADGMADPARLETE